MRGLRQQKRFLLLQKLAVSALDTKQPFGINAVDFGHVVDHVVQKVAVVAHHHAREGRAREQFFQPQNAFEIQVIGGLVQKQQVGLQRQLARNRQAPLPAAGERFRAHAAIRETRAAQRKVDPRGALQIVQTLPRDRFGDDFGCRAAGFEFGLLRHVAHARVAAHGDGAGIGLDLPGQNLKQRGFARAVRSNQAQPFAIGNAERNILEQHARAVPFGE